MEQFALTSHERALLRRTKNGHFDREILAYGAITADEGPRADTTPEKLAGLKELTPGGKLTAGVSSQISDGAAALLVASEAAVKAHGLSPAARVHHMSVMGADPVIMLTAPIPATKRALERTGLTVDDIDVFECNEAFASVPMAWQKELGVDPAKLNPNGGAIAIGHPVGASGARIMTTLLHELERTGGRYGLQTMCEGGGRRQRHDPRAAVSLPRRKASSMTGWPTEDEVALAAEVSRLLERTASREDLKAAATPTDVRHDVAWKQLATQLGVAGLAVSEDLGGAGADLGALAAVAEQIGRACAAVPFLSTALATDRAHCVSATPTCCPRSRPGSGGGARAPLDGSPLR